MLRRSNLRRGVLQEARKRNRHFIKSVTDYGNIQPYPCSISPPVTMTRNDRSRSVKYARCRCGVRRTRGGGQADRSADSTLPRKALRKFARPLAPHDCNSPTSAPKRACRGDPAADHARPTLVRTPTFQAKVRRTRRPPHPARKRRQSSESSGLRTPRPPRWSTCV